MAISDDKVAERANRVLAQFAAIDEADINETINVLMGLDKGQKLLWWLLQIGKVGLTPFTADPHTTAFQCGELNVGQQLLARYYEANPIGYAEMQMKRKAEDDRRNEYAARAGNGHDLFPDDPGTDSGGSD